jgi:hypothetical protein
MQGYDGFLTVMTQEGNKTVFWNQLRILSREYINSCIDCRFCVDGLRISIGLLYAVVSFSKPTPLLTLKDPFNKGLKY